LFFKSALRSNRGSFPAEALGTAAEGLLYSDAAFANAGIGTKGGTLDWIYKLMTSSTTGGPFVEERIAIVIPLFLKVM
jgi:hypothetical protein